ncbi:MAG: hypothetical protein UZ01_01046 [Candidatus Brocadia sinica]|nr:MAG: hypothetical protein UZ01_01046 [Candidatus Brocadia sinica]
MVSGKIPALFNAGIHNSASGHIGSFVFIQRRCDYYSATSDSFYSDPPFYSNLSYLCNKLCVSKILRLGYRDAAPSAMIGASNHFEVAIATSTMLFGLSSGASLATVVGVLIEVPVMLMLVKICLKTQNWFR